MGRLISQEIQYRPFGKAINHLYELVGFVNKHVWNTHSMQWTVVPCQNNNIANLSTSSNCKTIQMLTRWNSMGFDMEWIGIFF